MKHLKMTLVGILFFTLASPHNSKAQTQFGEDDALYLSTDLWLGNYWGYGMGVNYLRHDKFSAQVGWSRHFRDSQNVLEGHGGFNGPCDEVRGIEFLGGKAFELTKYRRVRLNLLGGIAFTKFKEPTSWSKIEYDSFKESLFGPSYSYTYTNSNQVSLVIQPKLEIPFSRALGFSLSGRLATSTKTTSYELGAGLIVGLVRAPMYSGRRR